MENWWLRFLILYSLCLFEKVKCEPLRIFPYHGNLDKTQRDIQIKTITQDDDNDAFSSRFYEQFNLYSNDYKKKRDSEIYSIIDPNSLSTRINCNYSMADKKLTCSGQNKIAECFCVYKMEQSNKSFLYFGIEKVNFDQKLSKIMLYPRTLGQTNWLNSTIWSLNRFIRFSIHDKDDKLDFGFKVNNDCFQDMLNVFESTKFYTSINLIKNEALKFNSANVKIIGSLIIV